MQQFVITIKTDFPDADTAVREAAEKIACEVGWGDDHTTSIEVVERASDDGLNRYIAGWEMEPGPSAATNELHALGDYSDVQ